MGKFLVLFLLGLVIKSKFQILFGAEDIIFKDIKSSPFCTVDHKDCKNLVIILK